MVVYVLWSARQDSCFSLIQQPHASKRADMESKMKKKTMDEIYQEAMDAGRLGDAMLVKDENGNFRPAYFKVRPEKKKPEEPDSRS